MFGLGPAEFILILVFALIVFGPKRLPELGKQIVQTIREFRKVSRELEDEIRGELPEVFEEESAGGGLENSGQPPSRSGSGQGGKEKSGRKKDTPR